MPPTDIHAGAPPEPGWYTVSVQEALMDGKHVESVMRVALWRDYGGWESQPGVPYEMGTLVVVGWRRFLGPLVEGEAAPMVG